ncbi:MAG: CHAD domain-containing protein [Actinomycetota bacterium]
MAAPHDPSLEIVLRIPPARVDAVDRQVAGRNQPEAELIDGVWRRTRTSRVRGAVVCLSCERRADVALLRITLVRGTPLAVIALARRWVVRHGLWFDGDAGADGTALVRAPRAHLDAAMSVDTATREMVRVCLVQVVGNAGAAASGAAAGGGHEHVHQVRVGIRKLRTVLRELGPATGVDPLFGERLGEVFGRLGAVRDREVVLARWADDLRAAGAPSVDLPAAGDVDAVELLRNRDFTVLLLDLLAYVHGGPADEAAKEGDGLVPTVVARLDHLHHDVVTQGRHFGDLAAAERHRLRRRVKRLRYLVELVAPLFKRKRVSDYLAALTPAQEALGTSNDVAVARGVYRRLVDDQPQAWFALGWLAARSADAADRCAESLVPLIDAKRAWRGVVERPKRHHR